MENLSPLAENQVIDLKKSVCTLKSKLSEQPNEFDTHCTTSSVEVEVEKQLGVENNNDPKIVFSDENFSLTYNCHSFNIYVCCALSFLWVFGTIVPKEIQNVLYPPQKTWYTTIQIFFNGPPKVNAQNVWHELYALWAFNALYFLVGFGFARYKSSYDRRENRKNEFIDRKKKVKNLVIVLSTVAISSATVYMYRSYRFADLRAFFTRAPPSPPPVPVGFFREFLVNYLCQMVMLVGLPIALGVLAQRENFKGPKKRYVAAFGGFVVICLAICYFTGYNFKLFGSENITPLESTKSSQDFQKMDILKDFVLYSLIGSIVIMSAICFAKAVMVFGKRISLKNPMQNTYQKIKITIQALYKTFKFFNDELMEKYEGNINHKVFFALRFMLRVTVFVRILKDNGQRFYKRGSLMIMGFVETVVTYGKTIYERYLQTFSLKRMLLAITIVVIAVMASGWYFNDAVETPVLPPTPSIPSPPETLSLSPEQEILFMVALPSSCLLVLLMFTIYTEMIVPIMTYHHKISISLYTKFIIDKFLDEYKKIINRKVAFALKNILRVTVIMRILKDNGQRFYKRGSSMIMGFVETVVTYGKPIYERFLQTFSLKRMLLAVTIVAMAVIASGWYFNDAVEMDVLREAQSTHSTPSQPGTLSLSPEQEILFMVALPSSCLLVLLIFTIYTEMIVPMMTCRR
eukprot:TCONS_00023487-protein